MHESTVTGIEGLVAYQKAIESINDSVEKIKEVRIPSQNVLGELIAVIRNLKTNLYGNSIVTFCSAISNFARDSGYAQIDPVVLFAKKWEEMAFNVDEGHHQEFLSELKYLSSIHNDWLGKYGELGDLYSSRIWPEYHKYITPAQIALQTIKTILDVHDNKYEAMLMLDFENISPSEFEMVICDLFSAKGYNAYVTDRSGDFGIDVIATRGAEVIAIQAKKYSSSTKVGNVEVQKTLGGMMYKKYKATSAILATTSTFTKSAIDQAQENPIELWDRERVVSEISKHLIARNS